jgi:hypothetical protein
VTLKTEHKGEPLPPCAFCGRPTALIAELGAVAHELPTCETYDALSAADYLKACQKKLRESTEESKQRTAELEAMLDEPKGDG